MGGDTGNDKDAFGREEMGLRIAAKVSVRSDEVGGEDVFFITDETRLTDKEQRRRRKNKKEKDGGDGTPVKDGAGESLALRASWCAVDLLLENWRHCVLEKWRSVRRFLHHCS